MFGIVGKVIYPGVKVWFNWKLWQTLCFVLLERLPIADRENGYLGVGLSGIDHHRSYKVIIQGHGTKKNDLTKHLNQVCVWDEWIGYTREYVH